MKFNNDNASSKSTSIQGKDHDHKTKSPRKKRMTRKQDSAQSR
jgi:hypothetical protein